MYGIINAALNMYLMGLIIYGIIMIFEIKVSLIKNGIPLYDIPIGYIRSIVKPITIGDKRFDLSFIILYFALRFIQRIL